MINKIIDEALIAHKFTKEHETELTSFYKRESGSAIRFAILHKLDELTSPAELNAAINQSAPDSFHSHPAFKKNCDLICIHHLNKLAEFKEHEEQIFAIEEDPHFFKKYILYYSDTEEAAIQGYSFDKLVTTITDKSLFSNYKDDPLAATQYSVAAKIFIKLPFLELPFAKGELVSLRLQAGEAVTEEDLDETYAIIQKCTTNNIDELIKELIANELENNAN
ncbi:ABC-three component system middle component 1 [Halomonas sp. E19]|uniref:ABC-three component system middle component 1 n=1 Tax=Halomonas sp. E19 TaxID=3397247 RepID=UPI004034846B